jgi:hypothetical protein
LQSLRFAKIRANLRNAGESNVSRTPSAQRRNKMDLFEMLENNKGTVSSELGKEIAQQILNGKIKYLKEAVNLTIYDYKNSKVKNIRAGAAKIIECVAEARPDLVQEYLCDLLPALEVEEPQTRWMVIRIFGFCSELNSKIAKKGISFAKQYIREKQDGQLCLVSSADIFLGDYGKISKNNANEVYPILLESSDNVIKNEHNWILESFIKIIKYLNQEQINAIKDIAKDFRPTIINKTSKLCDKLINK